MTSRRSARDSVAANLIELVLESVPKGNLNRLVREVIDGGAVTFASASELPEVCGDTLGSDFLGLLAAGRSGTGVITIRVERVFLGPLEIADPLLQVLEGPDGVDVSLCFTGDAFQGSAHADPMTELQAAAVSLQSEFGLGNVICGFEPAEDEDTRYFTNEQTGPMS